MTKTDLIKAVAVKTGMTKKRGGKRDSCRD